MIIRKGGESEKMNRREAGEGFRRISNCLKDRDEELSFFRDLKKREKDQAATLLHPVSEEFEPNGSFGLSRMNSGGRKGAGLEFLADPGKNDYNWLKTPPATPLFPSLEMETIGQDLVIQRELPIIQPLSRFAGNAQGKNRPTTPNPKPKLPQRHKTPTGRPSISSLTDKRNMKTAPLMTHKSKADKVKQPLTTIVKSTVPKESHPNSNMSRTTAISQVSNQTTNRPTSARPASATRGRPTYQKQETNSKMKMKRESCSPRGRKLESDGGGNRVQVVGSGMVDKLMNARMSSNANGAGWMNDRQSKIKLNTSLNHNSAFGRFISNNSLDMGLKHMDIQRDSSNGRKIGMVSGRKY